MVNHPNQQFVGLNLCPNILMFSDGQLQAQLRDRVVPRVGESFCISAFFADVYTVYRCVIPTWILTLYSTQINILENIGNSCVHRDIKSMVKQC